MQNISASGEPSPKTPRSLTLTLGQRPGRVQVEPHVPANPGDGFGSPPDLETTKKAVDVVLDGRGPERESLGDLLVGEAFLDQPENLPLAPGQRRFGQRRR